MRPRTAVSLFARDVPGLEFPEGKDLLQLVWCALMHEHDHRLLVMPQMYWRNEAEVFAGGLLSEIPEVSEGRYDDGCLEDPRGGFGRIPHAW
ncbi:hypothetical protein [Streptomyces sp. NPDC086766]|uniref:hypothetical protein n=1 Tax=Streptomyces sp. NPDC086766 TaxID=3365754 RepID=UPI00382A5BE9